MLGAMNEAAGDPKPEQLRVLELYCGIGGCAAALSGAAQVVAAVDVSRVALGVYAHNFAHPLVAAAVESLTAADLRRFRADLWWLSPPCQPFTRRGLGRDLDDPRARGLVALLDHLARERPPYLALENVPGFETSRARARLLDVLERGGYTVAEQLLCPSELGMPNRRRRYYLVAGRGGLAPAVPSAARPVRLADCLDADPEADLAVASDVLDRYQGALHIVDAADPMATTACFTAAYGRSHVRSGSYLATPTGARRFTPREILRLLDFPPTYALPADLPRKNGWRLAGNSLALRPVRQVLARVPALAPLLPRSA